jgi:hypothetical protein
MSPDDFKPAWRAQASQSRLTMNAEVILEEVRRSQRHFSAVIFWRDVREVGTAILLVPLWFFLGAKLTLPWTWYLMVPVLVWSAGFMLVHRMRHERRPPEPGEPLRQHVESSLAHLEQQIWLLRHVHWWCLLPFFLAALAFFGQTAWRERSGGWWSALAFSTVVALVIVVLLAVYWINQFALRQDLEPRRRELKTLLLSLNDETHEVT